jgi:hypothetical protein
MTRFMKNRDSSVDGLRTEQQGLDFRQGQDIFLYFTASRLVLN